jgi:prepilin-type N-terminal cleavage/methylation domain-containing protein
MALTALPVEREKIRISKAGNLTRGRLPYGFTLLELVVVLVIVSTFLAVTVPVFRVGPIFSNPLHEAQAFGQWITSLKTRAVQDNVDIFLHIDTVTSRVWLADSSVDVPEDAVSDDSANVPENLHITGVELASDRYLKRAGTPDARVIRLSRHGYSDAAILHLSAGDIRISLKIEPFYPKVEIFLEPVSFDDCVHSF